MGKKPDSRWLNYLRNEEVEVVKKREVLKRLAVKEQRGGNCLE